jgi:hypothetical protein
MTCRWLLVAAAALLTSTGPGCVQFVTVFVRNETTAPVEVRSDLYLPARWNGVVPPGKELAVGELARADRYWFSVLDGDGRRQHRLRATDRSLRLGSPPALYLSVSPAGATLRGGGLPDAWRFYLETVIGVGVPVVGLVVAGWLTFRFLTRTGRRRPG